MIMRDATSGCRSRKIDQARRRRDGVIRDGEAQNSKHTVFDFKLIDVD